MANIYLTTLLAAALVATASSLRGTEANQAEIRLPYREFQQLTTAISAPNPAKVPAPALRAAHLTVGADPQNPCIDATFDVTNFSDNLVHIPLLQGPVTVVGQEPADALLVMSDGTLCLTAKSVGSQRVRLKLMSVNNPLDLTLPPCPSALVCSEASQTPQLVMMSLANRAETPITETWSPLPSACHPIRFRWLDAKDAAAALHASTAADPPPAATDEGTIHSAEWSLRIEPDGAMLAQGTMEVTHANAIQLKIDTPAGMKLLRCQIADQPSAPQDLGDGALQLNLPASPTRSTRVAVSFTGTTEKLHPVEGTLALSLPKTPMFVQSLRWEMLLPPGYQAETFGNLTRQPTPVGKPDYLLLSKNLLRDERPETRVFYQRSNLAP